jgi:hypothetical protein
MQGGGNIARHAAIRAGLLSVPGLAAQRQRLEPVGDPGRRGGGIGVAALCASAGMGSVLVIEAF